jgi:aspartate/methionine/tyrosine aminotransferase
VPLSTLPGMRERTITISGASKTFSVTGWRIGWIVAPSVLTAAIRKVHDFLTVGAPAPLAGGVCDSHGVAGPDYYDALLAGYRERRDVLYHGLIEAGFRCTPPSGAYYIMTDFSALSDEPDDVFARRLARGADSVRGVASVPGSSFFHHPPDGRHLVRFAFCKRLETLAAASAQLKRLI